MRQLNTIFYCQIQCNLPIILLFLLQQQKLITRSSSNNVVCTMTLLQRVDSKCWLIIEDLNQSNQHVPHHACSHHCYRYKYISFAQPDPLPIATLGMGLVALVHSTSSKPPDLRGKLRFQSWLSTIFGYRSHLISSLPWSQNVSVLEEWGSGTCCKYAKHQNS